jgi:fumarate reductase flavoprotein subunit
MAVDYDVIIVGGGGAGLAAAASAIAIGAQVAILEAGDKLGGSTALSGGVLLAAGTSVQEAAGVTDSVDALFRYYLTLNQFRVDPALVYRLCANAGPTVKWFQSLGVEFRPDDLFAGGADGVRRSHKPATHGAGLIETLEGLVSAKCDVSVRTRVSRLLLDGGSVAGVLVDGEPITARSVVIATGGFGNSPEFLARYYPEAAVHGDWVWYIGNEHSRGDGLRMGLDAGAGITGMNRGQLLPTPGFLKRLEVSLPPWLLMVNHDGRRFMDESTNAALMAVLIGRQSANECYAIFDETMRVTAAPSGRVKKLIAQGRAQTSWVADTLEEFTRKGRIFTADSIVTLAGLAGIDSQVLESTVAQYNVNANAVPPSDSAFFKTAEHLKPIATAPFYAARIRPATVCLTSTGLKIDVMGRVLDNADKPIRGLYAAGEASGGTLGEIYAGGGNSVVNAMVGGTIAGREAARHS